MEEDIDLKPCPFCKWKDPQPFEREVAIDFSEEVNKIVYFVLCPMCHASGPCCDEKGDLTMEQAMAAWNDR